jgi:hypothetical protein
MCSPPQRRLMGEEIQISNLLLVPSCAMKVTECLYSPSSESLAIPLLVNANVSRLVISKTLDTIDPFAEIPSQRLLHVQGRSLGRLPPYCGALTCRGRPSKELPSSVTYKPADAYSRAAFPVPRRCRRLSRASLPRPNPRRTQLSASGRVSPGALPVDNFSPATNNVGV